MKKIQLGFVIVFAVIMLYAGASWFAGMRAQSALESVVDRINQHVAQAFPGQRSDAIQLEMTKYQRGVFISTVRYTLHVQGAKNAPVRFEFQDTVHHGPFPWERVRRGDVSPLLFYSQTRLSPNPLIQPWFDVTDGQPLQIQTRIAFSQDVTTQVDVAPTTFQKGRRSVQFSGGQLTLRFRNRFTDNESTGSFASLRFTDGRENVQFRDVTLSGQTRQRDDVAQTESQLHVASIALTLSELGDVAMERFGVEFAGEQAGDLVDASVRYHADKVTALGLDLGAFGLGFSAKRIDLQAFSALLQTLQVLDEDEDEDDEEDDLFDAVQTHVRTLLEAEPAFVIDPVRWTTHKGESRVLFSMDLFAPDEDVFEIIENYGLQTLRQAHLAVDVSRAMALHVAGLLPGNDGGDAAQRMLPVLFDQYAAQLQRAGLVRVDGDTVSLQLHYRGEDESVELNGQHMSLGEFVMRVMQTF